VLPCAALLATLAACDQAAPSEPPAVAVSYALNGKANLHLVETTSSAEQASVTTVIAPSGGLVRVGPHDLFVPKHAVLHPTIFTMTVQYGRYVVVELQAIDKVTGAEVSTFPQPLQLKLSYEGVSLDREDVHRLEVVWLQDESVNGRLVPVRTTLQPNERYVIGWVTHFSQYAMGMN
jgi:hypothetical protein